VMNVSAPNCVERKRPKLNRPAITLQGQAVGTQQSWRKLGTEEPVLIRDIQDKLLQSPMQDRVKTLSKFIVHVYCPQKCERFAPLFSLLMFIFVLCVISLPWTVYFLSGK
jgi:hypothetical protein